jgi:hypothetical protein
VIRLALPLFLLVLVLGGCREEKTSCEQDTDCDPSGTLFLRCLVDEGICGCVDERGCGDGEVCNASGRCQAVSGCLSNDDCQSGQADRCANQFCDSVTGQCVGICECGSDETCCTQDGHCPFRQICNSFEGRCVEGCRGDGDCVLGEGCVGAGLAGQLGVCEVGQCTANNQCALGEVCNLADGLCVVDVRGPYCAGCSGGVASDDCGTPANYCLIDTSDPTGQGEFCGVDCILGQACPFGYDCQQVIVLPQQFQCVGPETCSGTGGICSRNTEVSCDVDEDCPEGLPGSNCPRARTGLCQQDTNQECENDFDCCGGGECPEGSCMRQICVGGEGAVLGACTCLTDSDCPRETCDDADLAASPPVSGFCSISGQACFADEDCNIACVDGGCLIGANCAPANDRNCRDLTTAAP